MAKVVTRQDVRRTTGARRSRTALLIIDALNEFDFPEGRSLFRRALPAARRIQQLKTDLKERGTPIIYVNDNFGRWQSDRTQTLARCLMARSRGRPIAKLLEPAEDDYFVIKPKHSAFFSTTLETLLAHLGVRDLILTGFAGNICVLHTALDAHARGYGLAIPMDCVASNTATDHRFSMRQFREVIAADVRPSAYHRRHTH